MNDEGVDLLLVRTHQDDTATPAHVFNRGPTPDRDHYNPQGEQCSESERCSDQECVHLLPGGNKTGSADPWVSPRNWRPLLYIAAASP